MLNLEAFSSPFEPVQQEIMNEMTDGGPLGSNQESFQPLTAVWLFGIHYGLLALRKKKTAQSNSMALMYNYMKEKENRKRELSAKERNI